MVVLRGVLVHRRDHSSLEYIFQSWRASLSFSDILFDRRRFVVVVVVSRAKIRVCCFVLLGIELIIELIDNDSRRFGFFESHRFDVELEPRS